MTEVAERGVLGARKLVLGFDAGCMTCSELARKIEEEVGDKLEVRSLHDPQMAHWREQALGEGAPWAPTLVEANGGEVKAWTGLKMSLVLSRRLGPVGTWRVMQLVGEIKSAPKAGTASGVGLSRGQFIKNLGGATLGVGVLTASGGLASPAYASEDEIDIESLAEAFSIIEDIPDSVMAQGNEAASKWLRARLQSGAFETQGILGCARTILWTVATNIVPVTKIRAAIRAFGGAFKLARFIVRRYRLLRRPGFGYSRGKAIRRTLRAVARRTRRNTGELVYDALDTLFNIRSIRRNCF